MQEPIGHITVNERVPTPRFNRFVEEKVKDWIREHELAGQITSEPAEYEVAFFDEDALDEISCLVVIQVGDQLWRAWETADNPRMALLRSIDHLHTDEIVEEDLALQNQNMTTGMGAGGRGENAPPPPTH